MRLENEKACQLNRSFKMVHIWSFPWIDKNLQEMHKIVPNLLRYETGIFEALFVFIFEEGNTKQFKNQIKFFRVDIVVLSLPSKFGDKGNFLGD